MAKQNKKIEFSPSSLCYSLTQTKIEIGPFFYNEIFLVLYNKHPITFSFFLRLIEWIYTVNNNEMKPNTLENTFIWFDLNIKVYNK